MSRFFSEYVIVFSVEIFKVLQNFMDNLSWPYNYGTLKTKQSKQKQEILHQKIIVIL